MEALDCILRSLQGYDIIPATEELYHFNVAMNIIANLGAKLEILRGQKMRKHWNRIIIELIQETENLYEHPELFKLLSSFINHDNWGHEETKDDQ